VETKFLLAGYRLAVPSGGMEGPLLDGCDYSFVDAVAESACHLDVGDFAGRVDDNIEDNVSLGAVGEDGEVRLRRGKVAGKRDVDVSGTERIRTRG
jgi:hypothetical protein